MGYMTTVGGMGPSDRFYEQQILQEDREENDGEENADV